MESTSDPEFFRDKEGDGFYSRFGNTVDTQKAIEFIKKYDFDFSTKSFEGSLPKQKDTKYLFECFFEDENYQYKLGVEFDTHFHGYGRHVFVNFTNNEQEMPIVENDHITIYNGGFNQTVVFQNKLDHEITLEITDPSSGEDGQIRVGKTEVAIPSGKMWSHFFKDIFNREDQYYNWKINPDLLEGTILFKPYPRCMTENEVRSLYAQVEAYPQFPTYLPPGYSFECGVHNMNSFVHLGYWTNDLREKFEDKPNDSNSQEFFASGGVTVDYYNEYILNNWTPNPDYDKYKKQAEKAEHPWATTLTISGQPAVLREQYFWKDGEQYSFYELLIFLDDEIQYRVRSGLPESEIIKIAESLFSK